MIIIFREKSPIRLSALSGQASCFTQKYTINDIREESREFYKLFYHLDLTEEQLDEVLNYADDRHQSS